MLPPNENYFLPITAIRRSRVPASSKKELFVTTAYTENHKLLSHRVCSETLAGVLDLEYKILFHDYPIDSLNHD